MIVMDPDDASILDTVMSVVTRYGMKRTTMADLARGAGVSRQTLYDRFGDKDRIMAAAIDHVADRICADLRRAFADTPDLGEKIDAFFDIAVWPVYRIIQALPDAADLETGMGPASAAAGCRATEAKRAILAEMLRGHLPPGGPAADQVAFFVEHSSSGAKASSPDPEELDRFLAVLRASILALARPR